MDSESIVAVSQAIANLWKIILIFCITFLVYVLRESVSDFIRKVIQFEFKRREPHKETELSIQGEATSAPKSSDSSVLVTESHVVEQTSDPSNSDYDENLSDVEKDDQEKLTDALKNQQFKKAYDIFRDIQTKKAVEEEKKANEVGFYYYSYIYGDTKALQKLQNFIHDKEVAPLAYQLIGRAYEYADNYEKAFEAYKKWGDLAEAEEELSNAIFSQAKSLFELGKHQDAFRILIEQISITAKPLTLSKLYRNLASLYDKSNKADLRLIALEKALEYDPNNTDLLFTIALAYGNRNNDNDLALLHYSALLKFDSNHSAAQNNLGVVYDVLDMPIKSISFYKSAAELDETLAMANLIYKLIGAGFKSEAEGLIDKALKYQHPHENVGQAMFHLSQREEKEKDKEKNVLEKAHKRRRFLLNFARARFEEKSDQIQKQLEGKWLDSEGRTVIFKFSSNKDFTAFWQDDEDYKFSGEFCNFSAEFIKYKKSYSFTKKESIFQKFGNGYGYINKNDEIIIMIFENKEYSFSTLTRLQSEQPTHN